MSPYREPTPPPEAPKPTKRVVMKPIPAWLHLVVSTACILAVGGIVDLHPERTRVPGLLGALAIVLFLGGIASLISTGQLVYRGSEPGGAESSE
jgi:ribose/xylose/arabinose/galactoside ABC-type transport system permease subunit